LETKSVSNRNRGNKNLRLGKEKAKHITGIQTLIRRDTHADTQTLAHRQESGLISLVLFKKKN
jgi:hypothetical protein